MIFPASASEIMLAQQGKWVSTFFHVWFCTQPKINTLSRTLFQVLTTTSEAQGTNKYMRLLTKCVLAHDKNLFFCEKEREREVWSVFWIGSYVSLTQCWPDHRHCVACIYGCGLDQPLIAACLIFPVWLSCNWILEHYLDEYIQELSNWGLKHNQLSPSNVIMARNNV